MVKKLGNLQIQVDKRNQRASELEGGSQKELHEQVVAEVRFLNLQITNTKQLYNAAALSVDGEALKAANLPTLYK